MRDDARLARARAGEDQQRAVGLEDGFLLFGIEAGEQIKSFTVGDRSAWHLSEPERRSTSLLFYRDALREVPRLIDVAAAPHGDVDTRAAAAESS